MKTVNVSKVNVRKSVITGLVLGGLILVGAFLSGCSSKPYHYQSNWQYAGQYGSQDFGRGQ